MAHTGALAVSWWVLFAVLVWLLVAIPWRLRHRPAKLSLTLPTITSKEGIKIPNYELPNDAVAYIPIQTLDASGNPTPPPPGDVFTVVSSVPASLTATIGVMPSGPLSGQPASVCTPLVPTASGITVTLTDSSGLTADVQIIDVIVGVPTTDFLDISAAVTVPQPPPA